MIGKLSDKQRLRIQTRHRVSIENHGYQPQALYWSSREIQEIRFQKLLEMLTPQVFENDQAWSLLDVGCGFGDLKRYFAKQSLFPDYTGIDVAPAMVASAKAMDSDINICGGELFDFNYGLNQFDYVMLSGALNEVVETEVEGTAQNQGDYARAVIKKMYQICTYGVAFNLLDRRHPWVEKRFDLQSFYPLDIIEFCQGFAVDIKLVEGYLENDFTVYLYKAERAF